MTETHADTTDRSLANRDARSCGAGPEATDRARRRSDLLQARRSAMVEAQRARLRAQRVHLTISFPG